MHFRIVGPIGEIDWYEAHGVGAKEYKIKRILA